MWHYVLSRICRNLHSDIEIDRNQRSEELLKLEPGKPGKLGKWIVYRKSQGKPENTRYHSESF